VRSKHNHFIFIFWIKSMQILPFFLRLSDFEFEAIYILTSTSSNLLKVHHGVFVSKLKGECKLRDTYVDFYLVNDGMHTAKIKIFSSRSLWIIRSGACTNMWTSGCNFFIAAVGRCFETACGKWRTLLVHFRSTKLLFMLALLSIVSVSKMSAIFWCKKRLVSLYNICNISADQWRGFPM
jgi:hypothetical protein